MLNIPALLKELRDVETRMAELSLAAGAHIGLERGLLIETGSSGF